MRKPAFILLLLCSIFFTSLANGSDTKRKPRIFGGEDAEPGQFPWMVALYYMDDYVCSASLISESLVLTAAHCLMVNTTSWKVGDFTGMVGSVDLESPETKIRFSNAETHPKYAEDPSPWDAAILIVTKKVPTSSTVEPICLANETTKNDTYETAKAMGWGQTEPDSKESKILQFLKVNVSQECPPSLCLKARLTEPVNRVCEPVNPQDCPLICLEDSLQGPYLGDSGGPLVTCETGKQPMQIGILSTGNQHGDPIVIGNNYIRVSHINDFIAKIASAYNSTVSFQC